MVIKSPVSNKHINTTKKTNTKTHTDYQLLVSTHTV